MRHLYLPFLILGVLACSDDEAAEVGIALNWTIVSQTAGTQTCLDVSAATVEWRFRRDDGLQTDFTHDCVDTGQPETIPSGVYSQVDARLERGDGVVIAECQPDYDVPLVPTSNQVAQCVFEVP